MKRIAYLLHRFPCMTDTFIKREIRSLQKAGTYVHVISVWMPSESETTPDIRSQWSKDTQFMLPRSVFSIAYTLFITMVHSPRRLLSTIALAFSTSRPGIRGFIYQMFYFFEAVLVAEALRKCD